MFEYIFPQEFLDLFSRIAVQNCDDNGQVETLALALGSKSNNVIEIKELVFPSQTGTSARVEDNGKSS